MENFLEKFYDDVWQQMALNIDKEITSDICSNNTFQGETLTINSIYEIISKFQTKIVKNNPIYKLAEDNGFNLFKGDVAIISLNTAIKLGMKDNTKHIKISLYAEDDQIYFLKGSIINKFVWQFL